MVWHILLLEMLSGLVVLNGGRKTHLLYIPFCVLNELSHHIILSSQKKVKLHLKYHLASVEWELVPEVLASRKDSLR